MKSYLSEESQKVLILLKLDSQHLFDRIKNRMNEYLRTFEVKRTRVHFKDIFRNRYSEIHVDDLKECSSEVIVALDKYYSRVDEISWYLNHTEDLPNLVRDNLHVGIRDLEKSLSILNLHIDANLRIDDEGE